MYRLLTTSRNCNIIGNSPNTLIRQLNFPHFWFTVLPYKIGLHYVSVPLCNQLTIIIVDLIICIELTSLKPLDCLGI